MELSLLVGLLVSAIAPKLLERLKPARWAPFIKPYAPRLNRLTAIAVATLTTLGVTVDFDAAAGELTVGGLQAESVLRLGLTWILNFTLQETVYRRFVNTADSPIVRRGGFYLVPLLLAMGVGASCAKVGPALVAGEKSVRTAVVVAAEKVEPLVCHVEARKVLTNAPCVQLLDALEPAVDLAIAYNRALRDGALPNIPATIAAVDRLIDAVKAVVPASATKTEALSDLVLARVRAEGGR